MPNFLEQQFNEFMASTFDKAQPVTAEVRVWMRSAFFAGCLVAYTVDYDFSVDIHAEHDRMKRRVGCA